MRNFTIGFNVFKGSLSFNEFIGMSLWIMTFLTLFWGLIQFFLAIIVIICYNSSCCDIFRFLQIFLGRSGGTADAVDSKSTVGDNMRVQIPSPALKPCKCNTYRAFCCYIPLRYGDYYE